MAASDTRCANSSPDLVGATRSGGRRPGSASLTSPLAQTPPKSLRALASESPRDGGSADNALFRPRRTVPGAAHQGRTLPPSHAPPSVPVTACSRQTSEPLTEGALQW
jgi:hypothetical protein